MHTRLDFPCGCREKRLNLYIANHGAASVFRGLAMASLKDVCNTGTSWYGVSARFGSPSREIMKAACDAERRGHLKMKADTSRRLLWAREKRSNLYIAIHGAVNAFRGPPWKF